MDVIDNASQTSSQSLPVNDDSQVPQIVDDDDDDQPNEAERIARTIIQHLPTPVRSPNNDHQRDSSSERSLPPDVSVGPPDIAGDSAEQEAQLLDVDSTASGERKSTPDLFAEFCRIRLEQVASSVPSGCQSVRGHSRRDSNETYTEIHERSLSAPPVAKPFALRDPDCQRPPPSKFDFHFESSYLPRIERSPSPTRRRLLAAPSAFENRRSPPKSPSDRPLTISAPVARDTEETHVKYADDSLGHIIDAIGRRFNEIVRIREAREIGTQSDPIPTPAPTAKQQAAAPITRFVIKGTHTEPEMDSAFSPKPFTGKVGEDVETFLQEFEKYVTYRELDDNKAVALLRLLLKGGAGEWLDRLDVHSKNEMGRLKRRYLKDIRDQR